MDKDLKSLLPLLAYLLAIITAELLTILINPFWGVLCNIVLLFVIIIHSSRSLTSAPNQLIASLALVPLIRIISLSIPLASISQLWQFAIIYMSLLLVTIVVARILNISVKQLGISIRFSWLQIVIVLSGLIIGAVEYIILKPDPLLTDYSWDKVLSYSIIFIACPGFIEELIFRGVLQHTAAMTLRRWGIVYVSIIFAILHLGFLSWVFVFFVFFVSLYLGWMAKKTGSLFGVILAHGLANIILFIVMPVLLIQ